MQVQLAQLQDYDAWLMLASQVEDLFGPMVNNPDFQQTLLKNLGRGTVFCVRENDGPPGAPLLAGLFFSPKPPTYKISWLVVSHLHQRQGLGKLLVDHVIALVQPPAEMVVTTFGPDELGGQSARRFYSKLDFEPAEIVHHDYRGEMLPYQVYRRAFP